jgi:hypothetical protein
VVALKRVGVADVRAFIAAEGLTATLIPGSTRLMFSYFAGAAGRKPVFPARLTLATQLGSGRFSAMEIHSAIDRRAGNRCCRRRCIFPRSLW